MKTRDTPQTEKRRTKWSRSERGLLWTSSVLLVLTVIGFTWNGMSNNLPTANIPTPVLPSPNAYDYYVKASQQINGNPIAQQGTPTPAEMIAALPRNISALETYRQGTNYAFLNPPVRSFDQKFPAYASLRAVARLLILEGQVSEIHGNNGKAAQSYLDCLKLGQDAPRGGPLIASLVGIACESMGRRLLWLVSEKLTAADARAAVKRLEKLSTTRYSFSETMQEEKWLSQAGLLEVMRKENTWSLYPHLNGSAGIPALSNVDAWYNNIRIVIRGKGAIFQDYTAYLDAYIAHTKYPYSPDAVLPDVPDDPISQTLIPEYERAHLKDLDARMQNALLTAVLALRAYKLEKRDYPASLDMLVSGGYVTKVPDDPFAGTNPLRYRRVSATHYVLYSVGPDAKDDGGKPIDAKMDNGKPKPWAEQGMIGDFVARVNTY